MLFLAGHQELIRIEGIAFHLLIRVAGEVHLSERPVDSLERAPAEALLLFQEQVRQLHDAWASALPESVVLFPVVFESRTCVQDQIANGRTSVRDAGVAATASTRTVIDIVYPKQVEA